MNPDNFLQEHLRGCVTYQASVLRLPLNKMWRSGGAELVQLLPQMMTGMSMKRLLFMWSSLAKMGLLAMPMGTELLLGTLNISINTSITDQWLFYIETNSGPEAAVFF